MKIIDQDPVVRATAQRAINADKDESIVARQTSGKPFDKDRSSLRAVEGVSPSVQVATYYADRTNLSQDQKEMRVAGDLAARYYLDKLPSEEQTRISIAAGAVPPSQGVIIDADGDVVSEAMGFNGDHYVPFDLKNLRSLQGGQYVRTRATGGPTTEDIYTGLLSGARQLQVVSQSGVFTVEFDPSLRGGRRYSDKARQMVGRYQRLLDAVDQGPKAGLYQHDLDPAEIRQIRRDAADQFRDPDNAKTYGDRKINEARAAQSFNMLTDEEIDEKAKALLAKEPQANRGRLQELRNEVRDQARKDSVKAFTLDGDGYEAALKALKEEFPYFVRTVKREKLPDFVDARGLKDKTRFSSAKDRGYVSPKNAASGLANSVTRSHQGTQVRRGFYDAPEKTTAGAVTGPPAASEGAQEGQSAPEAAQASAGQLTNALANPTLHRLTEQFGHNVAQALPYLDVDETKYLTPEKDGDFKRLLANEVILAVDERATEHKEGFASYLATQGPQERAAYKKALNDIDDMLDGTNISNTIKRGVIESAEDLHATLELITPFAQGSPLSYDPSQNNGTPLHFGSVARIGMDLDAYQRIQEHEISQNTTTGNYLEMFSGADPDESDPLKVIPALITKIEKLPEGSKERESAVKDLEGAQKAYSFMRARDLAASFHELVGTEEPERPGKAPAPQAGATVPLTIPYTQQVTKPVIKRLTWHSPGGPVATAFQEFLASR